MTNRMPLAALGITSATDLGVLDANPPPFSFTKDLDLPPHTAEPSYTTSPKLDTSTYWQPGGPV